MSKMPINRRVFLAVFGTMLVVGTCVSAVAILRGGRPLHVFAYAPPDYRLDGKLVKRIETAESFRGMLNGGDYLLFVDCDWNSDVLKSHPHFETLAVWCTETAICEPVSVFIKGSDFDSGLGTTGVQRELEHFLYVRNELEGGGIKLMGGAGRIVWIRDGELVDSGWHWDLADLSAMKQRTRQAFASKKTAGATAVAPAVDRAPEFRSMRTRLISFLIIRFRISA